MIYFIRHGETDYNKQKIMQGWLDIPLNETGLEQARIAKENLKNLKIDEIYSSPLKRAYKTAEIINENFNLKIKADDRLKEIFGGERQGKCLKDLPKEQIEAYFKTPEAFGGESLQQFYDRVVSFFKEIENTEKNILIVSHSGAYRSIYKYLNNIEGFDFELEPPKNSEFIKIEKKD